MSRASQPELKKVRQHHYGRHQRDKKESDLPPMFQFMDKRLFIQLQGGRRVSGTLRGFDIFLNLVIDEAVEESTPGQKHNIGQVVCISSCVSLESGKTHRFNARKYRA